VIWQLSIFPSVPDHCRLTPGECAPSLFHARVVDDPGEHTDLGRDLLRARPHQRSRIPGRVGKKLLHRLVAGRVLAEPKQRRPQALPAPILDQAGHVHRGVPLLARVRQPGRHDLNKGDQPVPHTPRRTLNRKRSFHVPSLRTMTINTDGVRREGKGPFNQLTKSY
jgi:hypothetical protein